MKVLWVTNITLTYPAKYFSLPTVCVGGWIESSLSSFYNDDRFKLAVASIYNGTELKKCSNKNIVYYLIPGIMNYKYQKKIEPFCEHILSEFDPDIIHLHGSEFPHGLAFINKNIKSKLVLSIQGLVSVIGRDYLLGLNSIDIIKNITLRDILRNDNLFQQKNKYIKRGNSEKRIMNSIDAVIGRTFWDESVAKSINGNLKYFSNNETLRSEFYKHEWNINKVEKYSIYVSQASYPIKGFHILLNAISIVKSVYPNVKVYVAGQNIIKSDYLIDRIKLSGYGKYLISLLNRYDLWENISFMGILNEQECIDRMLNSHISIVPSILENSSNSLCEAMLLGVPSIASFVGGTPSLVKDGFDGLLYPCFDYEILARKMIYLFDNDELCVTISNEAKKTASIRHNKDINFNNLLEIYDAIIENNKERE